MDRPGKTRIDNGFQAKESPILSKLKNEVERNRYQYVIKSKARKVINETAKVQ